MIYEMFHTSVASQLSWLERHTGIAVMGSNSAEVLTFSGFYTQLLELRS